VIEAANVLLQKGLNKMMKKLSAFLCIFFCCGAVASQKPPPFLQLKQGDCGFKFKALGVDQKQGKPPTRCLDSKLSNKRVHYFPSCIDQKEKKRALALVTELHNMKAKLCYLLKNKRYVPRIQAAVASLLFLGGSVTAFMLSKKNYAKRNLLLLSGGLFASSVVTWFSFEALYTWLYRELKIYDKKEDKYYCLCLKDKFEKCIENIEEDLKECLLNNIIPSLLSKIKERCKSPSQLFFSEQDIETMFELYTGIFYCNRLNTLRWRMQAYNGIVYRQSLFERSDAHARLLSECENACFTNTTEWCISKTQKGSSFDKKGAIASCFWSIINNELEKAYDKPNEDEIYLKDKHGIGLLESLIDESPGLSNQEMLKNLCTKICTNNKVRDDYFRKEMCHLEECCEEW
jgi:hypothetical protein